MTEATEATKPIDDMTKDDLREFALGEHGVELDMTKKRAELIEEVKALIGKPAPANEPEKPSAKKASPNKHGDKSDKKITHLKHPANGRVYVATEHLMKRGDMLPCSEDGKLV